MKNKERVSHAIIIDNSSNILKAVADLKLKAYKILFTHLNFVFRKYSSLLCYVLGLLSEGRQWLLSSSPTAKPYDTQEMFEFKQNGTADIITC